MKIIGYVVGAALFSIVNQCTLWAQSSYSGYRLAVFDVHILKQGNQNLTLRCRMANTGRQPIAAKKTPEELLVEFDTLGLPSLLLGHEPDIAEAARHNCPRLKAGELSDPIWLTVRLRDRAVIDTTANSGCADMVFDTAFVENWDAHSMRVRFLLRNKGNAPAHLFAKNFSPQVNAYFVSGTKLTRGAIPAGSTSIQKGRNTLDGILLPGEFLEGTVDLVLKDRTKFSPNIALDFDPAQAVAECSRAGNVWVVQLRY